MCYSIATATTTTIITNNYIIIIIICKISFSTIVFIQIVKFPFIHFTSEYINTNDNGNIIILLLLLLLLLPLLLLLKYLCQARGNHNL